jgi:NAD(P)-dependent dehydrogenase (short-subunit alcohol dehydrogenase family)
VRRAAAEIVERFDRLDVLVNNAGVTLRKKEVTSEGVDAAMATNHLGPFLLTDLLLPMLQHSGPSRIVNLASDAHKFGRLHMDDLSCERRGYGPFGMRRYGETKTMNILFTRELARRLAGTGVTANAVHPGGVRTNLGNPPKVVAALVGLFLKSPEVGARTSLSCALDPAWAGMTGHYFFRSKPDDQRLNAQAQDDALAKELWDRSAALTSG